MPNDWSQYEEKPQSGDRWASFEEAPSKPTQQLTHPPTTMDRISSEVNAGGSMLDPEAIIKGVGNSLGRTTQAWGDMFSGRANPHTLAEMVPLVGPMAVDATQKMLTPGQRVEGLTDAAMMMSPALRDLNIPDVPDSVSRPVSAVRGGIRGAAKAAVSPIEYGMHKFPIPAPLAGAAAGRLGGSVFGPMGGEIGAVIGAGTPLLKGAIEGGREALRKFDIAHMPGPEPRPVFDRPNWTPPVIDRVEPVGSPGAVLPSGSVVGPAPPSVINPPPPRGFPPRVSLADRAGIVVAPRAPMPDVEPIYPSTPILPSGRIIGPRPSFSDLSAHGTMPQELRTGAESSGPVAPLVEASPSLSPSGVIRIGQTPAERIQSLSQSPEGTLGTRAEMMRQLRLSDIHGTASPEKAAIIRRFESPEYTPRERQFIDPRESQIIAPPPVQESTDIAPNGKRNQLK